MGGRARRVTVDQYDFFSVDYTFENGMHELSQARQVNGCDNNVSEYIVGTKGSSNCANKIFDLKGNVVWAYEGEKARPYVQEHTDLVASIRKKQPINEARNVAESTMVAIMGRISAYTGQETTWSEMMSSNLRLGPTEYSLGPVPIGTPPVPGVSEKKPTTAN
jgi:hypothetical protein